MSENPESKINKKHGERERERDRESKMGIYKRI